jgi:hypothetical protein
VKTILRSLPAVIIFPLAARIPEKLAQLAKESSAVKGKCQRPYSQRQNS